ncbi:MAG: aminopeptidase [Candidatus Methanoperedens sp.]|nr:aminopeptidase [Candidatus Methanoperedens sp.]MCE8429527.1 aminopeptidase [Candidatus Methanoperedens sp.]
MKLKKIIPLCIMLLVLILILNPDTLYISGISYDQAKILLRSEDIKDALKDKNIDDEIKNQLKSVPEIMAFGDGAGFPMTKAYSRYSHLDREVLYYSLSGSRKDSFEEYLYTWPLIGSIPYKGFIQIEETKKEETALKKIGYDTLIGKSITMSTLGILPDPIITPMIDKNDPTELVYVIFHERTHQLFFKKNDVTFNENAAVLLGALTSLEFFKRKFGHQSAEYRAQMEKLDEIIIFSNYIDNFYNELKVLYSKNISGQEKLKDREDLFQKHIDFFKASIKPELKMLFKDFDRQEINNAYILPYYRYYGKVHIYIQVLEKLGGDQNKTLAFFKDAASSKENPDNLVDNILKHE